MVTENQYYSYNIGPLPKGCQYCVRGEKLVLFVTGICPRHCVFCPVSDEKYQHDVSFANERSVKSDEDVLKEAELMKAKGAGITGGDPLTRLDRTISYIKLFKEKFGKHFHIHLYTSLNLVNEEVLGALQEAGLDEIRFHLDLDDKKFWPKLELAGKFSWDIGVEVPLIVGKHKELLILVDFVQDKVKFLNLNELEIADNNQYQLKTLKTKDDLSYAVAGSADMGLQLLEYIQEKGYHLSVHLCTAKLKDAVQLSNRIKREAKYSKKMFDIMDEEGLLTRGALYLSDLAPGFGYREKLKSIHNSNEKEVIIEKLKVLFAQIKKELKFRDEQIYLDGEKLRIILSRKNTIKNLKYFNKLGLKPAIVSEYPTADQLEMEVEFL
ncbi:radical SAM protein [Candidatus Woesearchaeota archaeon]|nr:radical SAM protein [Candidatus Woesearchaeota archaeon]